MITDKLNGVDAIIEGFGKQPPSQEHAQARADVCKTCPKNYTGGWLISDKAARIIHAQRQKKLEMKLKVEGEEKIGNCLVCECNLPLKVFFDIHTIFHHTSDAMMSRLQSANPNCWIVTECLQL